MHRRRTATSGDRHAQRQWHTAHFKRHIACGKLCAIPIIFDARRLLIGILALFLSLAPWPAAATLCPNDGITRPALLNLRACANGNSWATPWDVNEADCCNWAGVGCDQVSGRLLSLNVRFVCVSHNHSSIQRRGNVYLFLERAICLFINAHFSISRSVAQQGPHGRHHRLPLVRRR